MLPDYACVILTQGRRPEELKLALDSLLRQQRVRTDLVVVGNGWQPSGLPKGVRGIGLLENRGAPAGRNAGLPHVSGDLLFFLDDDARLAQHDALERIARKFVDDPELGLVQPRVAAASSEPEPRSWVPRLLVGDRTRSSEVTAVWEGAVAVRRRVIEQAGGWPEEFSSGLEPNRGHRGAVLHEGVDLAWRVLDAGYRVHYAGDVLVHHPAVRRERNPQFFYFSSRNRVWLARRHLRLPLAVVYLTVWFLHTLLRVRSLREASVLLRGYVDGLILPSGERKPLSWKTAWRMTRAGRPPVM
jgi:GT2 family glycosyltransferase